MNYGTVFGFPIFVDDALPSALVSDNAFAHLLQKHEWEFFGAFLRSVRYRERGRRRVREGKLSEIVLVLDSGIFETVSKRVLPCHSRSIKKSELLR